MKIISLFSGCGGLDLGFERAGFEVVWANEFDKDIWSTYEKNFPHTALDKRDIKKVPSSEVPNAVGIIGGPPCQSWSLAGAMRGINDERGRLFYEYLRLLNDKKPLFFLAENVAGIVSSAHRESFDKIVKSFADIGYNISYKLLNAADYGVPQDRQRVIIIGYRQKSIAKTFEFPEPFKKKLTLADAIEDLPDPLPATGKNKTNGTSSTKLLNHEYMTGGFSTIYMSRNRKRNWDEQSFTIQAGGRHAPLHPAASPMIKIGEDKWIFDKKTKNPYRRLSVRECARVQTFPDDFVFIYDSVADGYKMIGNAVPVKLAEAVAQKIKSDLDSHFNGRHIYKNRAKQADVAYKI